MVVELEDEWVEQCVELEVVLGSLLQRPSLKGGRFETDEEPELEEDELLGQGVELTVVLENPLK